MVSWLGAGAGRGAADSECHHQPVQAQAARPMAGGCKFKHGKEARKNKPSKYHHK